MDFTTRLTKSLQLLPPKSICQASVILYWETFILHSSGHPLEPSQLEGGLIMPICIGVGMDFGLGGGGGAHTSAQLKLMLWLQLVDLGLDWGLDMGLDWAILGSLHGWRLLI